MGLKFPRDRQREAEAIAAAIPRLLRIGKLIKKLHQYDTHNSGATLTPDEVHDLMFLINTLRDGAKRSPRG